MVLFLAIVLISPMLAHTALDAGKAITALQKSTYMRRYSASLPVVRKWAQAAYSEYKDNIDFSLNHFARAVVDGQLPEMDGLSEMQQIHVLYAFMGFLVLKLKGKISMMETPTSWKIVSVPPKHARSQGATVLSEHPWKSMDAGDRNVIRDLKGLSNGAHIAAFIALSLNSQNVKLLRHENQRARTLEGFRSQFSH